MKKMLVSAAVLAVSCLPVAAFGGPVSDLGYAAGYLGGDAIRTPASVVSGIIDGAAGRRPAVQHPVGYGGYGGYPYPAYSPPIHHYGGHLIDRRVYYHGAPNWWLYNTPGIAPRTVVETVAVPVPVPSVPQYDEAASAAAEASIAASKSAAQSAGSAAEASIAASESVAKSSAQAADAAIERIRAGNTAQTKSKNGNGAPVKKGSKKVVRIVGY